MRPTRRLFALAIVAAALFGSWMAFMPHSPDGLRHLVAAAGPFGPVAFIALWAIATPSLVSGTLLAAAGGLLFGPLVGSVVTIAGAAVGGAAAFVLARRLGGPALGTLGKRAARVTESIEKHGFRSILCLRAAPGVPATILNYAAGLSRIRLRDFVAASAIAGAPRAIAYTVLGTNAAHPSAFAVAAPIVILVAMTILGALLAGATFAPRGGWRARIRLRAQPAA